MANWDCLPKFDILRVNGNMPSIALQIDIESKYETYLSCLKLLCSFVKHFKFAYSC